jgi:sugar lactone lactonase YvrE
MRRFAPIAVAAAAFAALALTPLGAAGGPFPKILSLPKGFQPEGVAIGSGGRFYVGNIQNGAVYRGSVRTGKGAVLVPPHAGRLSVGVEVDQRDRIWVAGGSTGQGYVYDADTGADIASFQLTTAPSSFINDVEVTRTAAYFTDSFNPFLYKVAIGPGGRLGTSAQAIPLTGAIVFRPGEFNANGIVATPDGKTLVIVQSNTGKLFTVDPGSGVTREIDLHGGNVLNGDGLLLDGKTLYVVQNFDNQLAVVELGRGLTSGRVVGHLTDRSLDIPTTVDEFGNNLYVANARFTTPATPETDYWVTRLQKE